MDDKFDFIKCFNEMAAASALDRPTSREEAYVRANFLATLKKPIHDLYMKDPIVNRVFARYIHNEDVTYEEVLEQAVIALASSLSKLIDASVKAAMAEPCHRILVTAENYHELKWRGRLRALWRAVRSPFRFVKGGRQSG